MMYIKYSSGRYISVAGSRPLCCAKSRSRTGSGLSNPCVVFLRKRMN